MRKEEFDDLMLQIITNVMEEKHEKHFVYNRIFKKLLIFESSAQSKKTLV